MATAQRVTQLIGSIISEPQAAGCPFCGAKGLHVSANGFELWHPARDCCAESLAMQSLWRLDEFQRAQNDQTAYFAVERPDKSSPPPQPVQIMERVRELQAELLDIRRTARERFSVPQLRQAVATLNKHDKGAAYRAYMGRAMTLLAGDREPPSSWLG